MKIFNKFKDEKNYITFLGWIDKYNLTAFKKDLVAGITVSIITIPQVMAYAMLAGLPPAFGLYASIIPLLIYAFFGTSKHLVMGVVAIDMVIIAGGVGKLAPPGSEQYIILVALLALIAGIIQLVMASAKMGFLVNYISKPVIIGFTSAAALIIITSQFNKILGISTEYSPYMLGMWQNIFAKISHFNIYTLMIGGGSIVLLLIFKFFKPLFPGALVVIIASTFISWFVNLPELGVKIVGDIPTGLPGLKMPNLSLTNVRELLATGITLALVQFMTIISLGKTYGYRNEYSISPNRELFTLGLSNFFNSIFSGMPVSASFSRTAVNEKTGVETPFSNLVSSLIIIMTVLFFTRIFYYLPLAALGAVVITAAVNLIDISSVRNLFKIKKQDAFIVVFTFITTITLGVQEGILLGITVSLLAILYRQSKPNVAELGLMPGTRSFRDLTKHNDAGAVEQILILRIDASFSFTNAEYFKEFVINKCRRHDKPLEAVIIDGSTINDLDTTALGAIKSVINILEKQHIKFYLTGLKSKVINVLKKSGLYADDKCNIFRSPHQAITAILKEYDSKEEGRNCFNRYYDRTTKEDEEEEDKEN